MNHFWKKAKKVRFRTLSFNQKDGPLKAKALAFLNGAQLLSALNDNLFKFLTIYLLINLQGKEATASIMIWVGISYVLPFLLFSSSGGIIADRFSKQKMIVLLKLLEVAIILCGFFVLAAEITWGLYILVFMLSVQSAFLAPAKYSIIPELVKQDKISRANGLITSSTYLAVIVGTFLASFLTEHSNKNFYVGISACMIVALVGLGLSLFIPPTHPQKNKKKFSPLFIRQVFQTIKMCKSTPLLQLAVYSSAFFLFLGAFLQLNIVPFAVHVLKKSETVGGYLFLSTAIGIAFGAYIAGRSKLNHADISASCFASFFLGLAVLVLPFTGSSLLFSVITLALLGFFGGLYVVPLESYIQLVTSPALRGQVVGAANFLSFVGVMMAPICLSLNEWLGFSSGSGFVILGILILGVFLTMVRKLAPSLLSYFSSAFLKPFVEMHVIGTAKKEKAILFIEAISPLMSALLISGSPKAHLFILSDRRRSGFISLVLPSVHWIGPGITVDNLIKKIEKLPEGEEPYFHYSSNKKQPRILITGKFEMSLRKIGYTPIRVGVRHLTHFKPPLTKFWKRIQITFVFGHKVMPHSSPSISSINGAFTRNTVS